MYRSMPKPPQYGNTSSPTLLVLSTTLPYGTVQR
jgi:hypothetical protein